MYNQLKIHFYSPGSVVIKFDLTIRGPFYETEYLKGQFNDAYEAVDPKITMKEDVTNFFECTYFNFKFEYHCFIESNFEIFFYYKLYLNNLFLQKYLCFTLQLTQ